MENFNPNMQCNTAEKGAPFGEVSREGGDDTSRERREFNVINGTKMNTSSVGRQGRDDIYFERNEFSLICNKHNHQA